MNKIMRELGTPDQLGYVFSDLEKAIDTFSSIYQFEKTMRFDFTIEEHWVRGKHFPISLDLFIGVVDGMEYELITPLSDGPHKWFLDQTGGGLQHIGYNVDDYDYYANKLIKSGMSVLMNADCDVFEPGESTPDHHLVAAYFEKPDLGNLYIEVAARQKYPR